MTPSNWRSKPTCGRTAGESSARSDVGKPNPFMLRSALRTVGAHAAHTVVLGDRMGTDVRSGIEAGMPTILVLAGLSGADTAARYPYQPTKVIVSAMRQPGYRRAARVPDIAVLTAPLTCAHALHTRTLVGAADG